MIVEYRNAKKCYVHRNGYSQIFLENLFPNHRFGVEIVLNYTISTYYNHYNADR